jgi:RNA-binding protein YlmH
MLGKMARKIISPSLPEAIDLEEVLTEIPAAEESPAQTVFNACEEDAGLRLDHYLVARIPNVSRVRVQQLVEQGKVLVNDRPAKASLKLKGSEQIEITGRWRRHR